MRILLTNDDGIDAPGLRALYESVAQTIETQSINPAAEPVEIVVVAPDRCRSECGHSIEPKRPLELKQLKPCWHSVDGTPVDCVRVAVFAMQFQPDLVFSGINAGANLGVNLMVSGTFAAAREANLLGYPAMAVSHYRRPDVEKTWDHTPEWLETTIRDFLGQTVTSAARSKAKPPPLWNVNLPALLPEPGVTPDQVFCDVDRRPIQRTGEVTGDGKVHFDLDFHGRAREPDRDVAHCFGGKITISQVNPHWH